MKDIAACIITRIISSKKVYVFAKVSKILLLAFVFKRFIIH